MRNAKIGILYIYKFFKKFFKKMFKELINDYHEIASLWLSRDTRLHTGVADKGLRFDFA